MPISAEQKTAIEEIIHAILSVTGQRKRKRATIFLVLPDRNSYPQYYDVIPHPRSIDNIREGLEKNKYQDALEVYMDFSLMFWNALYYNEPGSQIADDAEKLKDVLQTEWSRRSTTLPQPRSSSPPPSSPQKFHSAKEEPKAEPTPVASTSTPITAPASVDRDLDNMSDDGNDPNDAMGEEEMEHDATSDEIVRTLERSLPRWPGFGPLGWMEEGNHAKYMELVHAIKSHKDVVGDHFAPLLENVPEQVVNSTATVTEPLSLKTIEAKVRDQQYPDPKSFDQDIMQLFEKCRRWYEPATEAYGRVLTLQRLYQALTSSNYPPPHGPPYVSQTNFAALKAGPGNVRPVHSHGQELPSSSSQPGASGSRAAQLAIGVTTHRVPTKDRNFINEINYKGWNIKLADWVHLSNPDDPSRPIIGQVFRCWVSEEESKKGQTGITVSWYYRPGQTFHPPSRPFWDHEIFKTSHFADHPIPDLIEKIACQFTARHVRGRPKAPYWYPGWPLYVCDSRYNDRDRVFVRIKNWNSCIPEEMRKQEGWMPIYGFERVVFPKRMPSPFLANQNQTQGGLMSAGTAGGKQPVNGPGGLIDEPVEENDSGPSGGYKTTRSRRGGAANAGDPGPTKGLYVGTAANTNASNTFAGQGQTGYGYYGGTGAANPMLPTGTTGYAGYNTAAGYSQAGYGMAGYPGYGYPTQQQQLQSKKPAVDRTVLTAAGGPGLGANAQIEKLSSELTRHFDRSPETNEMLWFASPPTNVAKTPTPKYSLKYLTWLARKRKRESGAGHEDKDEPAGTVNGIVENGSGDTEVTAKIEGKDGYDDLMDVDSHSPADEDEDAGKPEAKRPRRSAVLSLTDPERPKYKVPPTVTETLISLKEELSRLDREHRTSPRVEETVL
ncbi:hypothetical protein D9758_013118 [Tetrapyrgos nigripes]|uniref:Uncharacterized protein n=1 Tax=Tetrapyrgos nigripes TaxID=182062 RepID=A0A8H5CAX7_9AGAR|nr:hypothetical protein D9758_013118 [Tetrapyrgos nigripes]